MYRHVLQRIYFQQYILRIFQEKKGSKTLPTFFERTFDWKYFFFFSLTSQINFKKEKAEIKELYIIYLNRF